MSLDYQVKKLVDQELVDKLVNKTNYSKLFIELCIQRDLKTPEEISEFIQPKDEWLNDPFLMFDMGKAVDRIQKAIQNGEQITVYGDYDADGVTSTAIMIETLEMLGGRVNFFIPNRFAHGYGPNCEAFSQLIDQGTNLILTVDNGVTGHESIQLANKQGVDVIVTDHHELPKNLPSAYAIVHPAHPKGDYPFKELAGAGVAFKLAEALLGESPVDLVDLAAIGTISDLVTLTGENRLIAMAGIHQLRNGSRLSLLTLLEKIEVSTQDVNEETIGFKIAPLLNAVGRLSDAATAVEFLLSQDFESTSKLVDYLIEINNQRKDLVEEIFKDALDQANKHKEKELLVLHSKQWHEGVLGIVASRIVEHLQKPTILLKDNEESRILKGSGRSFGDFNLFEAGSSQRYLLENFGGHAMACGLSIKKENLKDFKEKMNDFARSFFQKHGTKSVEKVEAILNVDQADLNLVKEINLLRPFGIGNPKPKFVFSKVLVINARPIGKNKNHLKFSIQGKEQTVDAIAFGQGNYHQFIGESSPFNLLGELQINSWRGNQTLQFMVQKMDIIGSKVIDNRISHLSKKTFTLPNTLYICFHTTIYNHCVQFVHDTSKMIDINEESGYQTILNHSFPSVVFVDVPKSIKELREIFKLVQSQEIHLCFYSHLDLYLKGMPTRNEFKALYKFLAKKNNLQIKQVVRAASDLLNFDSRKVNLMIKVFLEAEFVKIDKGFIRFIENPRKVDLKQTPTYLSLKDQIEAEELVLFSSFDELKDQFNQWIKPS